MKKLSLKRLTLCELARVMPIIDKKEQRGFIGGIDPLGSVHNPYSLEAYLALVDSYTWTGGYVQNLGYCDPCIMADMDNYTQSYGHFSGIGSGYNHYNSNMTAYSISGSVNLNGTNISISVSYQSYTNNLSDIGGIVEVYCNNNLTYTYYLSPPTGSNPCSILGSAYFPLPSGGNVSVYLQTHGTDGGNTYTSERQLVFSANL